jgi:hypothetical protein
MSQETASGKEADRQLPAAPRVEPSPPSGPEATGVEGELAIENGIEIYKITADWIRFADAKAAVVLTVNGALAGLLIPHLKSYLEAVRDGGAVAWLKYPVLVCFALWLALLVLSAIWAFLCIVPYRRRGKHPALDFCKHFHGAAISASYTLDEVQRFYETYNRLGQDGLLREVMAGILIDAHISSRKYGYVATSINLLFASAIFGFLFLLLTQF